MASKQGAPAATTGASELSRAPIDLRSLRNDAKGELMDILDLEVSTAEEAAAAAELESDGGGAANNGSINKAKTCLVLDPRLAGALTLVVTEGPKLFKRHGVQDMIELSWFPLNTSCLTVLYLVRPEIDSMKMVRSNLCVVPFSLFRSLVYGHTQTPKNAHTHTHTHTHTRAHEHKRTPPF